MTYNWCMTCNIDAKGRAIRRTAGVLCCVLGIILLALALAAHGYRWLFIGIGLTLLAAGLFQLYESRKGWCALRAMGMKTPF